MLTPAPKTRGVGVGVAVVKDGIVTVGKEIVDLALVVEREGEGEAEVVEEVVVS